VPSACQHALATSLSDLRDTASMLRTPGHDGCGGRRSGSGGGGRRRSRGGRRRWRRCGRSRWCRGGRRRRGCGRRCGRRRCWGGGRCGGSRLGGGGRRGRASLRVRLRCLSGRLQPVVCAVVGSTVVGVGGGGALMAGQRDGRGGGPSSNRPSRKGLSGHLGEQCGPRHRSGDQPPVGAPQATKRGIARQRGVPGHGGDRQSW
jgi:hypothetical protein